MQQRIDIDELKSQIADIHFSLGVKGQLINRNLGKTGYVIEPELIDALANDVINSGGAHVQEILSRNSVKKYF